MAVSPATTTSTSLADVLLEQKLLTPSKLGELQTQAQQEHEVLDRIIERSGLIRDEDMVKAKAKVLNVPAVELFGKIVRAEILNIIPQELAGNYQMVAFNRTGPEVSVAMVDPTNFQALDAIEYIARKNNWRVHYFITSTPGLKYVLRQYESLSTEVEEALKGAEAGAAAREAGEV